jgi:four helix bundle protein
MSDFMFENLEVCQKSFDFVDEVSDIIENFERGHYHICDQFGRASLSILLNIAEGNGKWHTADRKKFFLIARGSAFECIPLLKICLRRNILTSIQHQDMKQKVKSSLMMLSKLISGTDNGKTGQPGNTA